MSLQTAMAQLESAVALALAAIAEEKPGPAYYRTETKLKELRTAMADAEITPPELTPGELTQFFGPAYCSRCAKRRYHRAGTLCKVCELLGPDATIHEELADFKAKHGYT